MVGVADWGEPEKGGEQKKARLIGVGGIGETERKLARARCLGLLQLVNQSKRTRNNNKTSKSDQRNNCSPYSAAKIFLLEPSKGATCRQEDEASRRQGKRGGKSKKRRHALYSSYSSPEKNPGGKRR